MQGEEGQKGWVSTRNITTGFLVALILLIVIAGLFIYYYFQTSVAISSLQSQLSDANAQVASLQVQLLSANSQVASLQTQLSSANLQVASLQTQLSDANSQISSLQDQLAGANSQISSLQSQLSSANSQVSPLQAQLTSANAQVSSLQDQISPLQAQFESANAQIFSLQDQIRNLQSIVNLSQLTTQANSVTISQAAGELSTVVTFTANYAGYIVVSGTSNTSNGYIKVSDSFSAYPYSNYTYLFGTGTTFYIPVLPGTVSVSFGNTNPVNSATATISVVYCY